MNVGNKIEFLLDKFLDRKIEAEIKRVYITSICYFEELLASGKITQEEFDRYRKGVLSLGNSSIRNLQEQIALIFENIEIKG